MLAIGPIASVNSERSASNNRMGTLPSVRETAEMFIAPAVFCFGCEEIDAIDFTLGVSADLGDDPFNLKDGLVLRTSMGGTRPIERLKSSATSRIIKSSTCFLSMA